LDHEKRIELLAEGEKATLLTLISNVIIIIFKFITGLIIGSVVLLASALDALTDLIASLAVLFGLRFSQKDPSKRFPYGYYRMETLATLIVSIFIFIFGLDVIFMSIQIVITPSKLDFPMIGLLISLVSIGLAYMLYKYNLRVGTKIASNALISTANEFRLDMITNSLVFLGIFGHLVNFPQLEGFVGLIIGIIIIKTGIAFGRSSIMTLLDAVDDPDVIDKMRGIVSTFTEVEDVPNIRIRRSGPYYFADIKIRMDAAKTIRSLAKVTHQLESSLKKEISQLDSIVISVDPIRKTKLKIAIAAPSLETKVNETPAEHFGQAPAFLIADINIPTQTIISTRIIENPHRFADRKRGIMGAELLIKEGIDILGIKDPKAFGIGPKAIFSENNVQIQQFHGDSIQEILKSIILALKIS
jgi:cation diffusion facilitator family transporter